MAAVQGVTIKRLASKNPSPAGSTPAHWVGNPPTSFQNPWPSFGSSIGPLGLLQLRFGQNRKFVPVPESRDELVTVRKPDWGRGQAGWAQGLKATWLGHAGFLIETSAPAEASADSKTGSTEEEAGGSTRSREKTEERRGIRILFDAVFSERTSPVSFAGPKRYTPAPCALSELPNVDLIVTSHDHYDHMDLATIAQICAQQSARGGPRPRFLAGLGNARHFLAAGAGIEPGEISECDWWDSVEASIGGSRVELTCTPAQHSSGRSLFNRDRGLWCSWCVADPATGKRLFFSGDTGYRAAAGAGGACCPAFGQIGGAFGGFDLALLPIGLCTPREAMGNVHCHPDDCLQMHRDLGSRRTVGMHYGTFRGGLSQYYEDVRDPPRWWAEACKKEGKWGTECGLCDVGETVIV